MVKPYLQGANPTERRGRKITSLRDHSHDSGIAGCDAHLLARDHTQPAFPIRVVVCPSFLFQHFPQHALRLPYQPIDFIVADHVRRHEIHRIADGPQQQTVRQ